MSQFGLAPSQPVNKGLAFDIKPIYPQIISMMENQKKQKLAKDKFAYQKQQDSIKFKMEFADLDYNGLKAKEMTGYQNYAVDFINKASKESAKTGASVSSMQNAAGLIDLKGSINQTRAQNLAMKDFYDGNNENGNYWYVDEGKITPILQAKAEAAQEARINKLAGLEYDAEALLFDPQEEAQKIENADHEAISNRHWEADEDARSQMYNLQGTGKLERAQITAYESSSMLLLKPDSAEPELDSDGNPIVLDETPDTVVNMIRMNNKKYDESLDLRVKEMKANGVVKSRDLEGVPTYYNKKDLIRDDYLRAGGAKTTISNIKNLYKAPTDTTTPDAEVKRQKQIDYVLRGANYAVNGTPKQINTWLAGVSKNIQGVNYNYNENTNKVTAEYTKVYMESLGIDFTDPDLDIADIFGAGAKLTKEGKVVKDLDFDRNSYQETLMDILNTSGHIDKYTREDAIKAVENATGIGVAAENVVAENVVADGNKKEKVIY